MEEHDVISEEQAPEEKEVEIRELSDEQVEEISDLSSGEDENYEMDYYSQGDSRTYCSMSDIALSQAEK